MLITKNIQNRIPKIVNNLQTRRTLHGVTTSFGRFIYLYCDGTMSTSGCWRIQIEMSRRLSKIPQASL